MEPKMRISELKMWSQEWSEVYKNKSKTQEKGIGSTQ